MLHDDFAPLYYICKHDTQVIHFEKPSIHYALANFSQDFFGFTISKYVTSARGFEPKRCGPLSRRTLKLSTALSASG